MKTTNVSLVAPPGEPIDQSNIRIQKLDDTQISFAFNSTSVKPFSPLVQVGYAKNGNLQVSAVVFVASAENPDFSGVNYQSVISDSGEPQLDFFLIYDAPEKSYQSFDAYRVDFIMENPPENLDQVQTFLWDEDPVSSRGTKSKLSK